MGLLILLQVALDLVFIAVVTWLLIERSRARSTEDPRLSRGLQLLTSKIAILQDLMDRSETLGRQLTQLIDGKQQDVQERVEEVERHLHQLQGAIEKSREVAKIFQDRIPHQEIIERQTTVKYLQAAKLAHQGFSVEDISKQVDIPKGELELIAKLNRDRLVMDKEPEWLNDTPVLPPEAGVATPIPAPPAAATPANPRFPLNTKMAPPKTPEEALHQATIARAQARARARVQVEEANQVHAPVLSQAEASADEKIKPVIFKRITMIDDLS